MNDLLRYLEAMTDLEPLLPFSEREELRHYQQSKDFLGDSRWPGWKKYLGPRPESPHRLRLLEFKRRRTA